MVNKKIKLPATKYQQVQKMVSDYFRAQLAKGATPDAIVEHFRVTQTEGTPLTIVEKASIDIMVAQKLLDLRDSAARRGKEFSLTFRRVKQLITQKRCFYSNVLFQDPNPTIGDAFIRTIDRVDNTRGYTDDNVVACTKYMNNIKANYPVEDLIAIHNGLFKHYGVIGKNGKPESKVKKLKVS